MRKSLRRHRGTAIIEFTIVSTVFLFVLFAIFEIGRYVFSLQMMNEVTRKAARLATVCDVGDVNDIRNMVSGLYPSGVSGSNLMIEYLDENGSTVGNTTSNFADIAFVRARLENVNYTFINVFTKLSGVNASLFRFETTLPAESIGVLRPADDGSSNSGHTNCS